MCSVQSADSILSQDERMWRCDTCLWHPVGLWQEPRGNVPAKLPFFFLAVLIGIWLHTLVHLHCALPLTSTMRRLLPVHGTHTLGHPKSRLPRRAQNVLCQVPPHRLYVARQRFVRLYTSEQSHNTPTENEETPSENAGEEANWLDGYENDEWVLGELILFTRHLQDPTAPAARYDSIRTLLTVRITRREDQDTASICPSGDHRGRRV